MEVIDIKIADLRPADYNPRHKSEHVLETVRASLREHGFLQPIVVNTHECPECGNRRNIIVGGHRRIDAAKAEGMETAPAVLVNLHLKDEKRVNLRLNAQEKFREGDLAGLLTELHSLDASSVQTLGFSADEVIDLLYRARYNSNPLRRLLADRFLIPPFSVFDSKQEYWQQRKNLWKRILGDLSETRVGKLAKGDQNLLMMFGSGASTFDPVTAEVIYTWFAPERGTILDPFAGEQTKGVVAAALGFDYHGVEIRPEQVAANQTALDRLGLSAHYYTGDSANIDTIIPPDLKADLIFTSPPYYDLEIYSERESDISQKQTYQQFMDGYARIIEKSVAFLKDNRFVVLKLGEIRGKDGFYQNFLGDNIAILNRLGFKLYNEIIYLQMLVTAAHRAERNMRKRKVVKVHQNIMTFYKGDPELLRNPLLLEAHHKVLVFLKGDPETVMQDFKNPPLIQRDIIGNHEDDQDQP